MSVRAYNGEWSSWGKWGSCSVTCGGGIRKRIRVCVSGRCTGTAIELSSCGDAECLYYGNWLAWATWSTCSATCGDGERQRSRKCDYYQSGGNFPCLGDALQSEKCFLRPCPIDGEWAEWGEWTECSKTCNGGLKYRKRECKNLRYGGRECVGASEQATYCNLQSCQIGGQWGLWSQWDRCSVTCGTGYKTRERKCDSPQPQFGGQYCGGNSFERELCYLEPCSNYGRWGPWTSCSVSCGHGVQTRTRFCLGDCDDISQDYKSCFTNCPIDGGLTEWSEWSKCTADCFGDRGTQIRKRFCTNPSPQYGGRDCQGLRKETIYCTGNIPKQSTDSKGLCYNISEK